MLIERGKKIKICVDSYGEISISNPGFGGIIPKGKIQLFSFPKGENNEDFIVSGKKGKDSKQRLNLIGINVWFG